jgi:hypothetical protein
MSDPKPGPANPAPQGADAPTPPGGPQRQDAAETLQQPVDAAPGTPDTGQPSPASDSSNPDANSEPVPEPDTTSDPATDPDAEGRQQENAESSIDQPSEG